MHCVPKVGEHGVDACSSGLRWWDIASPALYLFHSGQLSCIVTRVESAGLQGLSYVSH